MTTTNQTPEPVSNELPPLPEPHRIYFGNGELLHFTADQMRAYARAALAAKPEPVSGERGELIKHMVNRFLAWKLPQNFYPDSFISFDREKHDTWGGYPNSWPTGTNLFTAEQAKEMLEYLMDGYEPAALLAADAQRVEARPLSDAQVTQKLTEEFNRRGDSEGQGLHPYWKGAFTEGAYWALGIKEKS